MVPTVNADHHFIILNGRGNTTSGDSSSSKSVFSRMTCCARLAGLEPCGMAGWQLEHLAVANLATGQLPQRMQTCSSWSLFTGAVDL